MTTSRRRAPTLRRVARAAGELAVADYPGAEPAIVIMHGFPDRRTINEPLARQLVGRRVLLFDFLGYGESDKPADHVYDAASFVDDLDAVVSGLTDKPVVIIGHDASGPTAINWVQRNPERTEHLLLLNCYYHQTPSLRFPEVIALCADLEARPLTDAITANEALTLLGLLWQGAEFARGESARRALSPMDSANGRGKAHRFATFPVWALCKFVGPSPRRIRLGVRLVTSMVKWKFVPTAGQVGWIAQFADRPSTKHAFLGWTGDLHQNLVDNTARIESLRSVDCPVTVIFGRHDPYITPATGKEIASLFARSSVHLLDGGHWVQLEATDRVAELVSSSIHPSHRQ